MVDAIMYIHVHVFCAYQYEISNFPIKKRHLKQSDVQTTNKRQTCVVGIKTSFNEACKVFFAEVSWVCSGKLIYNDTCIIDLSLASGQLILLG